jgi:hypothetical protein
MKKHGLLLAWHTERRVPRAHDGTIVTSRSNERWCSDALEFTCWNGEIVRVAFALDSHPNTMPRPQPGPLRRNANRLVRCACLRVKYGAERLHRPREFCDVAFRDLDDRRCTTGGPIS